MSLSSISADRLGLLRACLEVAPDALLAIEAQAHSHPWTRGNAIDALAAGYYAQGLWSAAVPGGFGRTKGIM